MGNVRSRKITFEFLRNGKDRINRNVMCQDYKNGGIRMTNYRLSVKAQRMLGETFIIWQSRYGLEKVFFFFFFTIAV